jgi:ABC-type multidrug transport system fused ATPase/permease subunit
LKSAFFIAQSILVSRLSQLTTLSLRREFYRRTLQMDVATFGNEGFSDLMSRFTHDMEHLADGVHSLFGKLVREPLKALACLVGAAIICWRLLLFSLVIAPLAAFLVGRLARILKRANRRAMEEMAQIYGILEETFQGIKVVKAFTMERKERHRFHTYSKNYYKKAMRIGRYDALSRPLTEVMGIAMISLAIIAGAYLVLKEQTHLFGIRMCNRPLSTAALFTFYGLLAGVSDPARKLSQVFSRIQRASAASDRIYAMMDREPTVRDPAHPVRPPRHSRELSFENIHFSYVPGTPVLEDVNLRIKFSETIAIVGANGSGKTTLANLIPRFYDPNDGRVLLDGTNIRDMRLRDLRRQIGVVAQETLLFDDTVMANILYGSPDASEPQAIAAAKRAHAHRFIEEQLENGYETIVGPRGSLLSGGQRQRVALARAILREPRILILDEATSQVDLESEQLIHQVLVDFTRQNTTIIITHRMSTLDLADRIVVMDGGRIADVGTQDELLGRCELFSRLYRIQFKESA